MWTLMIKKWMNFNSKVVAVGSNFLIVEDMAIVVQTFWVPVTSVYQKTNEFQHKSEKGLHLSAAKGTIMIAM